MLASQSMHRELEATASSDLETEGLESPEARRVAIDLLMFEHGGEAYAVPAASVEGVIPWRNPAPVPGAAPHVRGVVQDRGRIVTVLCHPTGRNLDSRDEPRRIILCRTPEGLIGLPASITRAVTPATFAMEPKLYGVYAGRDGAYTFVAPQSLRSNAEQATWGGDVSPPHARLPWSTP
jgi:chemotaxis signal transduction protein